MKKIYKIAALVTPITVAVSSIGIYLAISIKGDKKTIKNANDESTFSTKNVYDHYKIFPDLNQEDFYEQIKIVRGKAVIDQQMISKIVNYVLDHMEVAQGDIGYSIKRESQTSVILSFKWESLVKTYSHDYKINLEQIQ